MASQGTILLVDDDEDASFALGALLEGFGYLVYAVDSGQGALDYLANQPPVHAVLLDVVMHGMDGIETLRRYRARGGTCPVIIMSGRDNPKNIIATIRAGAADYVVKPINIDEVKECLERVISASRPTTRQVPLPTTPYVGASRAMQRLDAVIKRVADSDVPVLITGESGVGKDVAARQLHSHSGRADKVFVKINCAALAKDLLESELFGHEKGAFTGADRAKPGQFELADGGTLFLDEIAEIPAALQAKLLQALQDGEFYRVGGQKKLKVDVRVVVATNRNLEQAIQQGSFREDLYYRLNVVNLHISPLRERREDIPHLLTHFMEKYARRYGWDQQLAPAVLDRFVAYEWPGNIRELENIVRRMMVLRDPNYVLDELNPRKVALPAPASTQAAKPDLPDDGLTIDLKETGRKAADAAEREAIVKMLAYTLGDKKEAVRRLGISYKALLYKMRDFGIGRSSAGTGSTAPRN
jgi:two-component system, NtrC family, response regulator AtoC